MKPSVYCFFAILAYFLIKQDDTQLISHLVFFSGTLFLMFSEKYGSPYFSKKFSPFIIIYACVYLYLYFFVSTVQAATLTSVPLALLIFFYAIAALRTVLDRETTTKKEL